MANILFLNPIEYTGFLFSEEKSPEKISYFFEGEFAEKFPIFLTDLRKIKKFDQLWIINWPWQFTQIRIFALTINTLKLLFPEITIKNASFFEYMEKSNYTPLLEANKREFLVKIAGEEKFYEKNDLPEGTYTWYAQQKDFTEKKHFIQYSFKEEDIREFFTHQPAVSHINPLYIKKPHITCPTR